jgi:outer membrane autotransporter protein
VSWVNEYEGDSTVRVDSATFDSCLKGHQWVTGVGFVEDGGYYQIYVDAEKSWGNTVSKAWGVNAGYRWKF